MKIHFNGAARTVTGSQFLIEVNGQRLLLECGLFQGKRNESYLRNLNFPFNAKSIDACVLSHAHIDHCGNLPNLVKNGYVGPIYCTVATTKLADLLLRDSAHIQESDTAYLNKKRAKRGEVPMEPLYTMEDAAQVVDYFIPVFYEQRFSPIKGVTVHLVEAGHILGSASVVLDIEEQGRKYRLWYSGDIGREDLPLVRNPVFPEGVDYLLMECTYGDKIHPSTQIAYDELREVTLRTIKRSGKVIIPSFSVGRTQELVYYYNRMITAGELPPIPVFVDSPLSVNATQIFKEFPEYFDDETSEFVRQGSHPALSFDQLTYVHSVEESKTLNDRHEPMVIISASGMMENGRILHHLANNIEDQRNTIVIVSWQAPDTLGRRLAERDKRVKIFGETYERKAEIATIGGLSAHADQAMLLKYAGRTKDTLKKLFLVHGEERSYEPLSQKLIEEGITCIDYPEKYDIAEI